MIMTDTYQALLLSLWLLHLTVIGFTVGYLVTLAAMKRKR